METSASESGKLKTGMQAFRGRVEADSLVRTLRNYLGQTGWIARGLAQGANSFLLLFQKANRYVALHITDAALTTELRIYVSAEAPFHPAPPLVINLNPAEE
ncbi:MAG: hypothetical protein FWG17_05240 [Desulfovibrionaceae bacterium]|nr:hypothetical protein [Desulfovibrionaceae bacterium]